MKKGFIPALVMIGLAVILFITVATIYFNPTLIRQAREKPLNHSATPTATTQQSPSLSSSGPSPQTSTIDETASWKTYTNTTYGFSLKYPPELETVTPGKYSVPNFVIGFQTPYESSPDPSKPKSMVVNIIIYPNPQNMALNDFLDNIYTFYPVPVISQSPIDGSLVLEGRSRTHSTKDVISGYKGYVYQVHFNTLTPHYPEAEKIFDQMISTFKFTQ